MIVEIIILSLDKYDIFLEKNMSYTELISNVEDFCTEMQKIDSEQVKVERSDSDLFYYETFYEILLEHGIHIKVLMQEEKIPYLAFQKSVLQIISVIILEILEISIKEMILFTKYM